MTDFDDDVDLNGSECVDDCEDCTDCADYDLDEDSDDVSDELDDYEDESDELDDYEEDEEEIRRREECEAEEQENWEKRINAVCDGKMEQWW